MTAMPRPRPPYLLRESSRHGRPMWFVRKGKGQRTRIRADYGTAEFWAEYQAALRGRARPASPAAGMLEWLIERYRDSQLGAACRSRLGVNAKIS